MKACKHSMLVKGKVEMADLEDGEVRLHVLLTLGLPKRHIWESMQVCLLPQILQLPGLHKQALQYQPTLPESPTWQSRLAGPALMWRGTF